MQGSRTPKFSIAHGLADVLASHDVVKTSTDNHCKTSVRIVSQFGKRLYFFICLEVIISNFLMTSNNVQWVTFAKFKDFAVNVKRKLKYYSTNQQIIQLNGAMLLNRSINKLYWQTVQKRSVNRVFFAVFTKMTNLTFLPMLYKWMDASILSYVKMFSCA